MITTAQHELFPATEALQRAFLELPAREMALTRTLPYSHETITTRLDMLSSKAKPSFDMIDLLKATGPVEDSISFPVIEWCADGEDEPENDSHDFTNCRAADLSDDEDSDFSSSAASLGKRSRGKDSRSRLVRSKASSCLASMDSVPCQLDSSLPRRSTWGQFITDEDNSYEALVGSFLPPSKRSCRTSLSSSSLYEQVESTSFRRVTDLVGQS